MSLLDYLDSLDASFREIRRAAAEGRDVSRMVDDARMVLVLARQLLEREPTGKFQKIDPADDD